MLPRLTALLALALGLLRIAALSLHPDKLVADSPFSRELVETSVNRNILDNVTCVVVAFSFTDG